MRLAVSCLLAALGVAASANASPAAPNNGDHNRKVILAAGGCGLGFYRTVWGCVSYRYGFIVPGTNYSSAAMPQYQPPYPAPYLAGTPAAPPFGPWGEPAQVQACLCEQQEIGRLRAAMDRKKQALDAIQRRFSDLDAQLNTERPNVNVNDPGSVASYKALLERRDAADQRTSNTNEAIATVQQYNARVADYNKRCGNRALDPRLVEWAQATLVCPKAQ